jgi:hypothetical protein
MTDILRKRRVSSCGNTGQDFRVHEPRTNCDGPKLRIEAPGSGIVSQKYLLKSPARVTAFNPSTVFDQMGNPVVRGNGG